MSKKEEKEEDSKPQVIVRTPTDLQRLKLEKLMKNPDKPVVIPEPPKERGFPTVPDFVRNVMGSSAGAGSGEFHVYRHLRRKEYARQRYMKEKGERERLDAEYREKLEENKKKAEEKTAKKRKKRLKKKAKLKDKKKAKSDKSSQSESSESSSDNEFDKEEEKQVKNANGANADIEQSEKSAEQTAEKSENKPEEHNKET